MKRFLTLIYFVCFAMLAQAAEFSGRVVGIADGDTLRLLSEDRVEIKVRLAGIDAPEKAQAFGQKAKQALSNLVFDKTVTIKTTEQDRYGRTVALVKMGSMDVNAEMVRQGHAWAYRAYLQRLPAESAREILDAEKSARSQGLGLWTDSAPVPPWEWRKNMRRHS
jgi:micrococcal nuclease